MALSESASEADQARAVEGREATDLLRAKQLSLSLAASSGAAEALSFKLWDTDWCVLNGAWPKLLSQTHALSLAA